MNGRDRGLESGTDWIIYGPPDEPTTEPEDES